MQKLREIYERYDTALHKVIREAPATAGLFGLGEDPRKHPCHMEFYEAVEAWMEAFCRTEPEENDVAYEAAEWIITAAAKKEGDPTYWFLYAAQGIARPLIPKLDSRQCAALREFYDDRYPRRDRMPVQKEVYKLLKKGASRR